MSKYISLDWLVKHYFVEDIDYYGKYVREDLLSEDTPTIEVSEDCISRKYLKSLGYINKGDFNSVETIREWIDNAPSVVPTQTNAIQHTQSVESVEPTTEQSSKVVERIEK